MTLVNQNECIGSSLAAFNANFTKIQNILQEHCDKINKLIDATNYFIDNPPVLAPVGSIIPFRLRTNTQFLVNGSSQTFSNTDPSTITGVVNNTSNNITTADGNWRVCNGNGGTPNLKGKFIVGTGEDNTSTTLTYNNVVGSNNHVLTISQMPSHNHKGGGASSGGSATTKRGTGVTRTFLTGVNSSSNTGNRGGGKAHENKPSSLVLLYLQRIR